jgi:hypothetical protein
MLVCPCGDGSTVSGRQQKTLVYTNLRGRDGSTTSPIAIPAYKAKEMRNVDLDGAAFARRRGGAEDEDITSANLTGVVSTAIRHVPGADDTAAELWLNDDAATPVVARNAAGTWSNPTLKDAIATRPQDVIGVPFNGKLFLFYDSTQDRGQVWDPTTGSVRRIGLATPAAPTAANTGAGSYAATARYYRVIYTEQRSSVTVRRSLASDVLAFTPSGSGTHARVTKPAAISEGETHWELYGGAATTGPFYLITTTVVGTTTYDHNGLVSDLSDGELMPEQGENTPVHSAKYAIADDNRLLMAGAWETGHSQNEVWFTPVLGTTSSAFFDEERLPTDNKLAFNERDSGYITGFGGPLGSVILVFKNNATWRIYPTNVEADPYRRKVISATVGCINHKTVVAAEDESGTPTVYWLSQFGPYRFNLKADLNKLVWDVEDIWATVNLAASTVVGHGISHPDKHQIWWWVATDGANEPNLKIVFDTKLGRIVDLDAGLVRDGWFVHDGDSANARCSVMFSNTIGATMSRDKKPYIGQHEAAATFWRCDTTDGSDAGNVYHAYVDLPEKHFGELHHKCGLNSPLVLGSTGMHTIAVTQTRDYGLEARTGTTDMEAVTTETRTIRTVEGVGTGDAFAVALRVGDEAAVDATWTIDAIVQPYEVRETLVQG